MGHERIKVAIGRRLFDSIEDSYTWLKSNNTQNCETRMIAIDAIMIEIRQITSHRSLLNYLTRHPYIFSNDELAECYLQQIGVANNSGPWD